MIAEARKGIILNTLNAKEIVNTRELADRCMVSEITIRRDLIELAAKGMLIRTRGGACRLKTADTLVNFDIKITRNSQHKEAICRLAASSISDGDIVFVDCGSTLSFITQYLRPRAITVITNSLPVVSALVDAPAVRLALIGGEVYSERRAIYGSVAEIDIEKYHATKAFIGADGVSLRSGLSSYDEREAAITRRMISHADEVFLLADSSKIEKNSYVTFASLADVHHLITDSEITPQHLRAYREASVDILTA
ncbi:MAG: DeoR/GlpR family DNA-binding transcription regulator [Tannerella sp.]|jgi:DeoR family fructose operon transcriptional repressor|nr:DeoR/GlpR family DNA-binding transcription regulator [Tannerella sp.]